MTRKQVINTMENVFSKGLYAGMIIFRSPIDNKIEQRHIYADANFEIVEWLDAKVDFYLNKDIPFVCYLNNSLYKEYKFEITEEDCTDE